VKLLRYAVLFVAVCCTVWAQEVPPALFVQDENAKKAVPLGLARIRTDVRIYGHLAETRTTMTFANPHDRQLAGDLYFPLPEGATISGYALDIEGVMVDGVIVEKQKGRQVFEKIVRQGVDPGLVEWVKGNNFKTRVFPIPAHGSRTIMVKYVAELVYGADGAAYHLPLNFKNKVADFSLRIEVVKSAAEPKVKQGELANFQFKKWRDSYVAETQMKDAALEKDLIVALPGVEKQDVLVEKAPDGEFYFCLHDTAVPVLEPGPPPAPPRHVRILWDASGSRGQTDHAREIELLKAYFGSLKDAEVQVDLVLFRNALSPAKRFTVKGGNCAQLLAEIQKVQYDGGTQIGCIPALPKAAKLDYSLLFTDGISNFGPEEPSGFGAPLYIFSADPAANHSFLHYLAVRSGGQYFNLKREQTKPVLDRIGGVEGMAFLAAAAEGAVIETYPSKMTPVQGHFALVGKLTAEAATVTVQYGPRPGNVAHKRQFTVRRADAVEGDLVARYWAQRKLDELLILRKKNEDKIVALGKRYGLVTPGTSLIVLDNLAQYVEHEITPPASLPQMRKEYEKLASERKKQEKDVEKAKLDRIVALWGERVKWWNTRFKYPKAFQYKGDDAKEAPGEGRGEGAEAEAAPEEAAMALDEGGNGEAFGVAIAKKGMAEGDAAQVDAAIVIKAWDPQTPYVKALKAAKPKERFAVYMKQRGEYGTSPAFFLDCADFFLKAKEPELGLQVLSNIAELELENAALVRVLAHRLAQLDMLDLSIMLFEEALRLRPEEPQSHRDLALVLARRAEKLHALSKNPRARVDPGASQRDFRRALLLLNHVVMGEWDRFQEIEVIALMEANRLIPRARAAGLKSVPLDPRLVKLLDVDMRIIMTWDADMTDMDLWVTEPSGEKAYYGHQRTTIGGNVSRDFTDGYGPEEYIVRKAMNGMYKIETDYFGSSAAELIGAVTLQVDVFTNYGRANEQRRSITLRLVGEEETILIGEVEF